jgi:hypothetical protein
LLFLAWKQTIWQPCLKWKRRIRSMIFFSRKVRRDVGIAHAPSHTCHMYSSYEWMRFRKQWEKLND